MTIAKGRPWGAPGPLPAGGVVVASDAEARAVVEEARQTGRPVPPLGLVGGDLCRTLGGTGDRRRLTSAEAVTFPVDLGSAVADGEQHWFVAHLVARSRFWTRALVAMNAQFVGPWKLGPRAHPNDGLLDTSDARLGAGELLKVRRRLATGTHLPHPQISERRTATVEVALQPRLSLWLDGVAVGLVRDLTVRVEPDALSVVV